MARKRAPSGSNRATKRKSRKAVARSKAVLPEKPSPLLELPAELRDMIYAYIAQNEKPARVDKRRPGNLLSTSPMNMVNKQVRQEFTSALYLSASKITATVRDFDFRHIVIFFNRLSDLELRALPDKNNPFNRPQMVIKLTFSPQCPVHSYDLFLSRWLNRCVHPTKKGTKVAILYTADMESMKDWEYPRVWMARWQSIHLHTDPGPGKEELNNIVYAVGSGIDQVKEQQRGMPTSLT